jgi:hypothetical protein
MTPAVLGRAAGVPFLISEAVLELIRSPGGEPEVAQVIAGIVGRAIAEGHGPEFGEARTYDVAGIEVTAMLHTVQTAPTAIMGVVCVALPGEVGPWLVRRALGEAAKGDKGWIQ